MVKFSIFLFLASAKAFQSPTRKRAWGSRLSYGSITFDDHATSVAVIDHIADRPAPPAVYDNIFEAPSLYAIDLLLKHSRHQQTIAIVRYHAPYCRACQKVAPKFERLTRRQPDMNFIQVPLSNKNPEKDDILEAMEIPSIPWGQVWHPGVGIVEELSLNPKHFNDFVAIVKSYQHESCLLPEDIYQQCGVYAAPYYRKERDDVLGQRR